MPPNFGLLPELPERIREKRLRYGAYRDRALADLEGLRRVAALPTLQEGDPERAAAPSCDRKIGCPGAPNVSGSQWIL